MKINLQCSAKLNSKYKTTIIPLIEKENMLPYLKKFLNLQDSKSNKKMIQDLEKQIKPTSNLSTSLFIELKGETYHLLLSHYLHLNYTLYFLLYFLFFYHYESLLIQNFLMMTIYIFLNKLHKQK